MESYSNLYHFWAYPEMSQNIDFVHQTNFLFGQFQQWTARHNTGIIHDNINEAMFLLDLFNQSKDSLSTGNITAIDNNKHVRIRHTTLRFRNEQHLRIAMGNMAGLFDFLNCLGIVLFIDIDAYDFGT